MPVREHLADHDDPGDLPLVTESATVERFEPLDRSRNDAVEAAAVELLDDHGEDRWHRRAADGDPLVDWDALAAALDGGEAPGGCAAELQVLRERHRRPYPSLATVGLAVDEGFDFVPGQYLSLRFRGTPRAYSVANPPSADGTELCIRRVPGGALTGELFAHLSPGDEVTVRGPCGEFVLDDPGERDLAFLATGTGVAPLRSMIEHVFERGLDDKDGERRDVWLFLGASWADDLPYRERFRALAETHDNFHFVPTCTREPLLSSWDGETDYVQQTLVAYLEDDIDAGDLPRDLRRFADREPARDLGARIDPAALDVYACGINAMCHRLEAAVEAVGVPSRRVHAEGYG